MCIYTNKKQSKNFKGGARHNERPKIRRLRRIRYAKTIKD